MFDWRAFASGDKVQITQAPDTPNEKRPGPGVIALVVAEEPEGYTRVRVRVVARGWLGAKGR